MAANSTFVVNQSIFDNGALTSRFVWGSVEPMAALLSVTNDDATERDLFSVNFINDEGKRIPGLSIDKSVEPISFEYQVNGKFLCVGWDDGAVSIWTTDGKTRAQCLFNNGSVHSKQVTLVKWSPDGRRLITGDQIGLLCVWAVDPKGTLSPIRQYRKKGAILSAVFYSPFQGPIIKVGGADVRRESSCSFFYGTSEGFVCHADDIDQLADVQQQISTPIDTMMFLEEKNRLLIITRNLLLFIYQVSDDRDRKVSKLMQLKLSVSRDLSSEGLRSVVWTVPGVVAFASQERLVRLIDVATDDSYNLSLSPLGSIVENTDKVICVAFSAVDRYLAAGTQNGLIVVWSFNGHNRDLKANPIESTSNSDWEIIYTTQCASSIYQLQWYKGKGILGALIDEGLIVLTEIVMQRGMYKDELAVIQTNPQEVQVTFANSSSDRIELIDTGLVIKGLSVASSSFVVWNGEKARVFRVSEGKKGIEVEVMEPFNTSSNAIVIADGQQISEPTVFAGDNKCVRILNFAGVQKGLIPFTESEGTPRCLELHGKFLAVVTDVNAVAVYDVYQKTAKLHKTIGKFVDPNLTDGSGASLSISKIRLNCDASKVAFIGDTVKGSLGLQRQDPRIYVYDRVKGAVQTYDFSTPSSGSKSGLAVKKFPTNMFWDTEDPRVITVETSRSKTAPPSSSGGGADRGDDKPTRDESSSSSSSDSEVSIFFVSSEHGVMLKDSFARKAPFGPLLHFSVPRLYFQEAAKVDLDDHGNKKESLGAINLKVVHKIMQDFIGMEDVDAEVKKGLLDFGFNLTLGKLDEAYKAVKTIGSPSLWENMAHMCVKTKRIDVAEVCLGNMGHARGAAAVRMARADGSNSSVDALVGVLAVQLGLREEAVKLFRESGRHDLLNQLFQASNRWDKAIEIAESGDRLHVKNTYFEFARYLESIGKVDEAIAQYEKSDTYRTEVPRMLYSLGEMGQLHEYINQSQDPTLLKWWASYQEGLEKYDSARKFYNKAGDYISLVRICCFEGDLNTAEVIVTDTNDKAAAYHFAQQLEKNGQFSQAIEFYALSSCYNHCIRLGKAHGLDESLMLYALKSTTSLMIECASYFEAKGELDKAAQLCQKGGDHSRAMELCFRCGETNPAQASVMFEMLNEIAAALGADTSPQTLARCAEFLMSHKQYVRAIDLYIMAKRYLQAIEMCVQNRVTITEELAEKLSPPDNSDAQERKDIFVELGKALKKQGQYALACRKYTQAGDRVQAIKCLARGNDFKAVIQYANVSRSTEIYVLAANFLQQMNWRQDVEILKKIIVFYTKANAFEQLAGFYDCCAQVEMDEFSDYDKAIAALKKALEYALKGTTKTAMDVVASLERRIVIVEKFAQAKRVAERDPETMVSICEQILSDSSVEEAIRSGDCYALLIDHFCKNARYKEAYQYVQEMSARRIPLKSYIDAALLDKVYKAVGVTSQSQQQQSGQNQHKTAKSSGDDEVDEEVEDEVVEEEEEEEKVDSRGRSGQSSSGRNSNSNSGQRHGRK